MVGNILNHTGKPLVREFVGRLPALQTAAIALLDDFQSGQLAFQANIDSIDRRVNVLQTAVEVGITIPCWTQRADSLDVRKTYADVLDRHGAGVRYRQREQPDVAVVRTARILFTD